MNKLIRWAVASLAAMAAAAASAADDHGHQGASHGAAPGASVQVAQAGAEMTEGEIRKVDKENKKITIKHGEIKNLGMPGMTMVFQVRDPSLLDKAAPGAKVRFTAEKSDGAYVVTAMEPLQ